MISFDQGGFPRLPTGLKLVTAYYVQGLWVGHTAIHTELTFSTATTQQTDVVTNKPTTRPFNMSINPSHNSSTTD